MSWVSTYEVAKTVWNAGYIATMNFTYVTEKRRKVGFWASSLRKYRTSLGESGWDVTGVSTSGLRGEAERDISDAREGKTLARRVATAVQHVHYRV